MHEHDEMIQMSMDEYGTKRWTLNGKMHRDDGPAFEYDDGSKEWYFNGKLHREDGPAVEYDDGSKAWYQHGKLHRIDGAAIEYFDGSKLWYVNDLHYDDVAAWARAALQYENKSSMQQDVDAKVQQVMQQDLFQ